MAFDPHLLWSIPVTVVVLIAALFVIASPVGFLRTIWRLNQRLGHEPHEFGSPLLRLASGATNSDDLRRDERLQVAFTMWVVRLTFSIVLLLVLTVFIASLLR